METKLRDEDQAARDTHTHTHTHKRAKGERERIRTQRKKNKREREKERKRAIVGKEQRARTFGNLDHFFRFLWRVLSVERKGLWCFFQGKCTREILVANLHLKILGVAAVFFLCVCCVPAHASISGVFWCVVMEKKKDGRERRRREKSRRSVCSLFFKRNEIVCV